MGDLLEIHASKINKMSVIRDNEEIVKKEISSIIKNRKITKSLYKQVMYDNNRKYISSELKKMKKIDKWFEELVKELTGLFEQGATNAQSIYKEIKEQDNNIFSQISNEIKIISEDIKQADQKANDIFDIIKKEITKIITLGNLENYEELEKILNKSTDTQVIAFSNDFFHQMDLLKKQIENGAQELKVSSLSETEDLVKNWSTAIKRSLSQNLISRIIAEYSFVLGYNSETEEFRSFSEQLSHSGTGQVAYYENNRGSKRKERYVTRKSDDLATVSFEEEKQTLTFGLTSKFYLSDKQSFKDYIEKEKFKTSTGKLRQNITGAMSVSSGSAGSLLSIIQMAQKKEARLSMVNYWSYAAFSESEPGKKLDDTLKKIGYKEEQQDVSKAITHHRLLILLGFLPGFVSAGKGDTSLIMSINGVLMSVPEIIYKILENESIKNLSYFFETSLSNNYYENGYLMNIKPEFWGLTHEEGKEKRLTELDSIKVTFHMRFYRVMSYLKAAAANLNNL